MRLSVAAALTLTACSGAGPRFLALPEGAQVRQSVLIAVTEGEHLRVVAAPVEGGRIELSIEPSVAVTLSLIALSAPLEALDTGGPGLRAR